MIGIYMLESPSGKLYIGQSWDIKKRHYYYSNWKNCIEQPALSSSIKKYGIDSHTKIILQEITENEANQTLLDFLERAYIRYYSELGFVLLNMNEGGSNSRHSEETRKILSEKRKKQSPPTLGKKFSDESRLRMSIAQKGKTISQDQKQKLRISNIGRIVSDETKNKLKEAKKKNNAWIGKKHSDSSKKLQSIAKKGNKINNKKVKRVDDGFVFDSLSDAAESIGIKMATLSSRIVNKRNIPPIFTYDV